MNCLWCGEAHFELPSLHWSRKIFSDALTSTKAVFFLWCCISFYWPPKSHDNIRCDSKYKIAHHWCLVYNFVFLNYSRGVAVATTSAGYALMKSKRRLIQSSLKFDFLEENRRQYFEMHRLLFTDYATIEYHLLLAAAETVFVLFPVRYTGRLFTKPVDLDKFRIYSLWN